jgi:hypothetical protein
MPSQRRFGVCRASNSDATGDRKGYKALLRAFRSRWTCAGLATLLASLAFATPASAAQPLETETARLLTQGRLKVENTLEYQVSPEGTEIDVPMAIEYGILDNLEIAVEPVWYTAIRPKVGRRATGIGDLEATLSVRFLEETIWLPALAAAVEVKLPTARDDLIGTGKADYRGYFIASKRYGNFETHLNGGYTIVGQPGGTHLDNIFDFALAEEWHVVPRTFDMVAEALGNTASAPENPEGTATTSNDVAVAPEAAGGELVGLMGVRYYPARYMFLSFGVSYDNNQAVLFRSGVTFWIN